MDSSDEEDVHQCGRCKEIFHSIDEYFVHKSSKVCKKPKKPPPAEPSDTSVVASNVSETQQNAPQERDRASELVCRQDAKDAALHESTQNSSATADDEEPPGEGAVTAELTNRNVDENLSSSVIGGNKDVPEKLLPELTQTSNRAATIPEKQLEENADLNGEQHVHRGITVNVKTEKEESTTELDTTNEEDMSRKRKRKARPKKLLVMTDEEDDLDDPEFTPSRSKVEPVTTGVKRRRGRPRKGRENKKPKIKSESPVLTPPTLRRKRGRPPKEVSSPPEPKPTVLTATVTVFGCPLCTYTSECRDELDRHLRRLHKMSLHNCEFCNKSFSDKYKLHKHFLSCSFQYNSGAFPSLPSATGLDLEDESGSDNDGDVTMEEEMQRKKPAPLFKCYECSDLFDTFRDIRQHLMKHHFNERRCNPAICEHCGKWFQAKERFWRHLTTTVHDDLADEEVARIKAETAKKKFVWIPTPKKSLARVFECEHCNKSFKYREAFNKHIKFMHPEDGKLLSYKFTCSSCNEQFNHRRTYLSHLKMEHGIKEGGPEDFKCPVCVKTFKQKAHKYRHIESLHSPMQLVPDNIVNVLESDRYREETSGAQLEHDLVDDNEVTNKSDLTTTTVEQTNAALEGNEAAIETDVVAAREESKGQHEGEDEGFSETLGQNIEGRIQNTEIELNENGEHSVEIKLDKDDSTADVDLSEKEGEQNNACSSIVTSIATSIVTRLKKPEKKPVKVTTWLSCPVCCEKVTSRALLLKHMQLHRVWVLRTEKGVATEGVQGVFDALNLRMPNIPQGLTDRETGLAIEDVLIQKTAHGVAIPQPEEHFNTSAPVSFTQPTDQNGGITLENTFIQDALQKETGLNTIDQSIIRDLVQEEPKETEKFAITLDRATIYKTVQKIVQDIKIKQLIGGAEGDEEETEDIPKKDDNNKDQEKNEISYLCPFCVKVHKSLIDCYKHVTSAHNMVAAFQCIRKGCRQVFGHVHDYEKHAESHRQAAFVCRVCNFHFEEMLDAVSHKSSAHRSLHQTEINRCDLCNRTFATKEALTKHVAMDKHHHQCDQCGKVMKNASDLKDHELTHKGIRSYLCDQCGAAFANRLHLSRHRRLHNAVPKCLQCDQCTATFAKREHLKRHMQTQHTDEKPFVCQYPACDKAFKRKDKLQDHYRMHSNETPYQCAICGKAYRYREALKYHEKTHLKECKHFCTMCEAGFPRPAALRAHLKEKHHINLKHQHSYPCPQCGNVFSRPERLKRHMEFRHSVAGDWKFKCPVCARGCAGKKSFKSHMLKKHSLDGTIEQLINIDVTPFLGAEKQRRKRSEVKSKIEMPVAQVTSQQHHQQLPPPQQQQQQPQQQVIQQQQQPMQIRVDDNLSPSVATAIIQPQQTHQSITIQNPQDPGSTIYLIPSANISEKDQLMQNMVGFQQLVLPPSAIQSHPTQTQQITAQHPNQAVIHNAMQNVTLTGATTNIAGHPAGPNPTAAAPLHTVLMTAHPAIQRPEATTASINLQQVTTSHAVQPHNTFSTISSSYTGFVSNYEQY